MLREIGAALVEASMPVQLVEQRLAAIAARYTTQPVQIAVLPTVVFVQIGSAVHQMESSVQPSGLLDVAGRIDEIAGLAAAGAIDPRDAVAAVHAARVAPPRFGPALTVLGYGLTTAGFGMMVDPTWRGLGAHLFLGLVVGVITQLSRPVPSLVPILPTLSAMVVTLLATWFVADVAHDGLLRVISPALIAVLPGMSLVMGAIELAGAKILSGSARLIYGLAQLLLMVYGVVLGMRIAGSVPAQLPSAALGWWSVYLSIAVIAVGLYLYLSAPRGSLPWLVLTIGVAVLVQNVAGLVANTAHSGFIAAMVSIPFAVVVSRLRGAPPAAVLTLAAFWSLVPGQLTFMSISGPLSGAGTGDLSGAAGTASISVAGGAIASIALGTLVGWSLLRAVTSRRQARLAGA
jgi:uncharacterized membrane protein YjjP (DUF1212 family)